jgi:hypothetical protein
MNRFIWWKREEKEKEKEVKHDDGEDEILLHSAILTIDNYADKEEKEKEEKKQKEECRKRDEKKQDKRRDSTFAYCIDGLILYLERCKMNLS